MGELLLNHLATDEGGRTLDILNIIKLFVFGVREKNMLKEAPDPEVVQVDNQKGLITRMIRDLESERLEDLSQQEELLEKINCPPEGFHEEQETNEETPEEEKDPPLTGDQIFFKAVIENLRHFVSMCGQPSWQLSSLASLTTCLALLGDTPGQAIGDKQTVILPLVHDAWHPLKLLFRSSNIFVVDEAFQCLMVMARHARDFIRRRTVSDVFPHLLTFFKTLQVMVADRDREATLAARQSRRILAKLQSGIWDLLELLDLPPLETDPIIQLLLDHQADLLQQDTSSTKPEVAFSPKRSLDANILWLKLNHR